MSKKFWVYILSGIFFLSAAVLGVTSVYRVDTVTVEALVVSEEAREEAEELQNLLSQAYVKNSIFSVNDKEAKKIVSEFPYFRMVSFKKSYPNRIVIELTEDAEVFAVPMENSDNYYILGVDGMVLGIRDSYINRLDNEENILVTGLTANGARGEVLKGDALISPLVNFSQKFSQLLGGIRRNVVSVEVIRLTTSTEESIFRITMREGVKIYIGAPMSLTEAKAQAAYEKYISLSAEQRMSGRISILDREGELIVNYAQKDTFPA